jgi:hypothetical protein
MHHIQAFSAAAAIGVAALFLVACQAGPKGPGAMDAPGKSAALRMMEQVAISAQKCWFASKDAAFGSYRMANELNSFSGRPRILLVPAKHPEGRPLLVVQAEGTPARLQAFGPLMQDQLGGRIGTDVTRWASGETGCGSAA